jgi:hypothetical protein
MDALSALIGGANIAWDTFGVSSGDFIAACAAEDLTGLVHERLRASAVARQWPKTLRDELTTRARGLVARELSDRTELIRVLDALAQAQVRPILLKGTALAYTVYASPALRPRQDTDLIIRHQDLDAAREVMRAIGYAAPVYCDGDHLFHQFVLTKDDHFGVQHAFDIHWKISTQSLFADLLTYDEVLTRAIPVPAIGSHARAAGPLHALLLACVHPVMHHRNLERVIWVYDIHLLASRLSTEDLERFADLAVAKGAGPICARGLALARSRFGTWVPDRVTSRLASVGNGALSDYLRPGRRWHHEFLSNLRGLRRWGDRLRLAREVLFPSTRYILASYGLTNQAIGFALLPALYLHRNVHGLWKVLVGRK